MNTILAAYVLDLIWGDPEWLPHPVRGMGKLIEAGEGFVRRHTAQLRWGGMLLAAAVTLGVYVTADTALGLVVGVNPWLERVVSSLLIYSCFSLRSLAQAAHRVHHELLRQAELAAAREQLSHLVGRDTQALERPEIIRATVESVAENTVDGFISPLFYALLGGAPLALAYKAVNTLDSMLGYRNPRYQQLGWAAARLDDLANYIPARLMYLLLPLASGTEKAGLVWRIMRRDGRKHPSPNSGIPESGFAAYLQIQLGGTNYYQGQVSDKPLLGDDKAIPQPEHITEAIRLMYRVSVWAIAGAVLLIVIF
jgi:adenosylcobinamide-phosphate synthase